MVVLKLFLRHICIAKPLLVAVKDLHPVLRDGDTKISSGHQVT